MSILFLYDPEQVPFGKLSPLYKSLVKVGQEEASNIVSFCYAGLVKAGGIRNNILRESGKDARVNAINQFTEEKKDLFFDSLEKGLLEKIRQDTNTREKLLESGDSVIVYESDNKDLGSIKGEGKNKVGEILMKIRKIVARERDEKREKRLQYIGNNISYMIYTAYKELENKIKNGVDDLSQYINKNPSEILEVLNINPLLPSVLDKNGNVISFTPFDKSLDSTLTKYLKNTRDIAKDLREIYAEEYNANALSLQKKDILYEYLINKSLSELPLDRDYKKLYDIYKRLKIEGNFNEEYDMLARTFKDKIADIKDFIVNLRENVSLENMEDRVYALAKNGLINIKINPIQYIPVKEIDLDIYKKFQRDTDLLAEKVKQYQEMKRLKKTTEVEKQLANERESIARRLLEYKKEQDNLLKLERFYMKKAKDKIKKKDLDIDDDNAENVFELWRHYEEKYPKLYDDIIKLKRQMKLEAEIDNIVMENEELLMSRNQNKKEKEIRKYIKSADDPSSIVYEPLVGLIDWASNPKSPSPIRELPGLLEEKESDKKLYIYNVNESSPLSPYHTQLIEIENFVFPNVITYVYYNLIKSLDYIFSREKNKITFSHDLLMINPSSHSRDLDNFKSVEDLEIEYDKYQNMYIESVLKTRATRSLYAKFKVDDFAKLLVASNPRVLVYNDNNDFILGSGPLDGGRYNGLNIIGETMNEIRLDLFKKYGNIIIEDIKISPKRIDEKSQFIMNDYINNKMREMLYVFILYSSYIKNSKTITLPYVNFVIDQLYYKTSSDLRNLHKSLKIQTINNSFEKEVQSFLSIGGYKINRDALNRLWGYIYILNELMNMEITKDKLNLYGHRKIDMIKTPIEYDEIKDFVTNIEYKPKEWFIETVKTKIEEYKEKYGNICVGIGLTYITKEGINKKSETKCNTVVSNSNMEQIYLQLLVPLLNNIKDDVKYKDFYISVFSGKTNLELLRSDYVDEHKKYCQELVNGNNKISCVLQTYVDVFRKLKNNKDITFISENSLLFVNRLLSTFGNVNISSDFGKSHKIDASSQSELEENISLKDTLLSKTGLNIIDKYNGVFEIKSTTPLTGTLYNYEYDLYKDILEKAIHYKDSLFPLSNTSMFACKIVVELMRSDRRLTETYSIKYEEKRDGNIVFNVVSEGDNIGIKFYIINKDINYEIPKDIYDSSVDNMTLTYQVVSTPRSINLLSQMNNVSKNVNDLARVLSFSQESLDINASLYESDEKVDLKDIKSQFKQVEDTGKKQKKGSDDTDDGEEGEEEESEEESEDSGVRSDDEEGNEESEEEDYYEPEDEE